MLTFVGPSIIQKRLEKPHFTQECEVAHSCIIEYQFQKIKASGKN
jgi:hypothetical protein